MEKLVVTDLVEGCDLARVECEHAIINLTITDNGAPEQRLDVRLLQPPDVDGKSFGEWVLERIQNLLDETEDDYERYFYADVLMMIAISRLQPTLDHKRERRFNLQTLDTSETLRELAITTGTEGHPRNARLLQFAGQPSTPWCRLLQEALYVRPDLVIPLADKHYHKFREQFFQEMAYVVDKLNEIETNVLSDLEKQVKSRRGWTPKQRTEALVRLQAMRNNADTPALHSGWEKAMQIVYQKALEMEDEGSGGFADLVSRARDLQDPVAREVYERKLTMLAEDDETFTAEYAECITRRFDADGANALLEAAIQRYAEVFEIPHCELVSLSDWPSLSSANGFDKDATDHADASNAMMAEAEAAELPVEWQQYSGFVHARYCDDIFDKWYMIGWITTNLVNRNECIRLLQREAESVFEGVLEYGFRLVYRKIRDRLSYLERRVFKLMYFRQPMFAYHLAALNPMIYSFFSGMDDDTQLLILAVLVLKRREIDGRKDLDKELERRWRAYLRFYPYWLEIIRDEDRVAKRQKTTRRKTLSLDKPLRTSGNARRITGGDVQKDYRSPHANVLEALIASSEVTVADWASKYCTETQARHILKVAAGETETKIAEDEGITQPAVSKNIRVALKRIRAGLVRDGVLTES